MRRLALSFMLAALAAGPAAAEQDLLLGADMASPAMTRAEMSRADVEALIQAADGKPVDLHDKSLSGLDLRGRVLDCKHWYDAPAGETVCVPFMVSSKGYGIVWDNPSATRFIAGVNGKTAFQSQVGERVSFFIITGNLLFGILLGGLPSMGVPAMGLIVAIFGTTLVVSLAGDTYKLKEVLILSIILSIGSYGAFVKLLNLQFPVWPTFITG